MKITGIRTVLYEYDLKRPIGDANSPQGSQHIPSLAVFVDTDAGLTGVSVGAPDARQIIHSMAKDLLIGQDPRGVRGLWQRMVDCLFKIGNRGTGTNAIAALDVALWDLKAKANDEPLWQTFGAAEGRAKAYASGIDLCLSDSELSEFYQGMAAKGIAAGKLKVGVDIDRDFERIGIMRDALATSGKTPALMVDSNEYWSPKQSIRHIRRFEETYDLTWVEEPARRWDYRGLRKVSESVHAAVATGENLSHVSEFMPLVDHGAVDIVQAGQECSGFTGIMQVADLAYAYELPIAIMNAPANFTAHLAAALPNHIGMEVLDAGRDIAMHVDNHIEDGWILLGDKPGLGIEFDEEKLAELETKQPADAPPSVWSRRPGAGLYEVSTQDLPDQ
jgi:L-alanine-DL-glutamate epimerase-like enolase superfamily enzyme